MRTSFWAMAFVIALGASSAGADDAPSKEQCLDAHEKGQLLERDGKLLESRDRYRTCAHKACPALVTKDCTARLAEIEPKIASVRVDSSATVGATVTLDGEPLPPAGADGTIELAPGEHVFRVSTAGGESSEKTITLEAGQKNVDVVLEAPKPAPAPEPEPEPVPAPEEPGREIAPAVWVLGGVAVVGLVGFVAFAAAGKSKQSELDTCKPGCNQSDVDSMRQRYLFADISLGVAAVAAGAAAYIYFTGEKQPERQAAGFVGVAPRAGGAELSAGFSF